MKVTDIFPQIKTDKVHTKKSPAGTSTVAEASDPAMMTDRVELSASSKEVQRMKAILQETPSVRMEKVQALKERIERGEYQVDPYRVADKMLISLLSENIINK